MAPRDGCDVIKGLVVGKFSPLHNGHRFLLEFAARNCDRLLIITYSSPVYRGCEGEKRVKWLRGLDLHARLGFEIVERDANAPANADNDMIHRRFCAEICEEKGFLADRVFSSEDYGPGFAAFLAQRWQHPVEHVEVDRERRRFSVSGTLVRSQLAAERDVRGLLPQFVARDFVQRVLLVGAESTGKSTLAEALGRALDTIWLPEFGRDLWEARGGLLTELDLIEIAQTQVAWEERALCWANRFLICDTSALSTEFYGHALFGRALPEVERLSKRAYDHVFLLAPDFPLVQDGTRQDEQFRRRQDLWLRGELRSRGVPALELKGSVAMRLKTALEVLSSGAGKVEAGR